VDADVGMHNFKQLGQRLLATAALVWETYPRQITAAALALVTGGMGGALALATVGPDAADLPVQLITERLELESSFAQQAQALESSSLTLNRSDTTRSSDTPESLLRRLGVVDAGAVQFLKQDPLSQRLLLGRAGRAVRAETTGNHALTRLTARWVQDDDGQFQRLVLTRSPTGVWSSILQTAPLVVNSRVASGIIRTSLFAATDDARLPDAVVVQAISIFTGRCARATAFHWCMKAWRPMENPCALGVCKPRSLSTTARHSRPCGLRNPAKPRVATTPSMGTVCDAPIWPRPWSFHV
jgi:hypothetical protein